MSDWETISSKKKQKEKSTVSSSTSSSTSFSSPQASNANGSVSSLNSFSSPSSSIAVQKKGLPVPCKFYRMGGCSAGKFCQFAHIKEEPSTVCKFFLKGTCRYGNKCALSHELPESDMKSPSPPSQPIPAKIILPGSDNVHTPREINTSLSSSSSSSLSKPLWSKIVQSPQKGASPSPALIDVQKVETPNSNVRKKSPELIPEALDAERAFLERFSELSDDDDDEDDNIESVISLLPSSLSEALTEGGDWESNYYENEENEPTSPSAGSFEVYYPSMDKKVLANGVKKKQLVLVNSSEPESSSSVGNQMKPYDQIYSSPSFAEIAKLGVIEPSDEMEARRNEELCPFAMAGNCRYGENCRYLHGLACPICQKEILHPFRPEEHEDHVVECSRIFNFNERKHDSSEIECGICFEKVLSKSDPRFGLLNCDHPFCLGCIRSWRQNTSIDNSVTHSCPICRTTTFFITPSSDWVTTSERKSAIIEEYKIKLSKIPCRYYNFGNGSCPFGTSCFYSHVNKNGTKEEVHLRRYMNGEEELKVVSQVKLSDFLTAFDQTRMRER